MGQRVKQNVTGLLLQQQQQQQQQQQKQANYKKNENKCAKNILFYHMTRTAPRAISLENHKKEFQYEGRTRQLIEPGKRVRKMRWKRGKCCQERISPPQKNPKTQPSFSNDKMLTVREVRESRPTAKYFPVRLDLTQSISTYYHTFIKKRK